MAKGFRFVPLGLVGLRAFRRTKVLLRDVTIVRDETGDGVRVTSRTGSARRFVEN